MKRVCVFVFFICLTSQSVISQSYNEFLKQLTTYQENIHLKKNADNKHEPRDIDTTTFNTREYMAIFSNLTPEPGCEVDCVYACDATGGSPMLYGKNERFDLDHFVAVSKEKFKKRCDSIVNVRVKDIELGNLSEEMKEERIRSIKSLYSNLIDKSDRGFIVRYAWDTLNHAIRYLIPQDNELGYFQLLIFHLFGDNFALFWHAYYNYRFPVYETGQIDFLIKGNREENFSICFEEEKMLPLLKENLTPRVKMEQDKCLITLYEFRAEGGLFRNDYSISRSEPYTIKRVHFEKLVSNKIRGCY